MVKVSGLGLKSSATLYNPTQGGNNASSAKAPGQPKNPDFVKQALPGIKVVSRK